MHCRLLRIVLAMALGLAAPGAFALQPAPGAALEAAGVELLALFDFPRMARTAVARNWRLASPQQQAALTAEFRKLLLRAHSTALSGYTHQRIEFKRLRMAPGDTQVRLRSESGQPGSRPNVDYDMEHTQAGWKVYDIKLSGVSLIATYREAFADAVRDKGLEGLIASLSENNRQGDAVFWTGGTALGERSGIALAMLHSALQGRR
jgi:phospholipid transport system substrate-binding protein